MDPGLGISGGALDIGNRIKMKTAIFYALFQMTLGLILSGFNNLHKKDCLSFFTESIMAILILWGLIGYICPYYIIKFFTNPVLDSDDGVVPGGVDTKQHIADS
jgi:vacuolar-type H+-ATPase subunit I/STV1